MAQAHFSWYYQVQNCFKEWVMYHYPQCKTSMYHYKGIPQKIKPFFFKVFPNLFSHPRVFVRFGKGEIRVQKGLVFFKPAGESATPPTHIWEVFPPKKRYPQWNPSMYHYNLNNVNFTAVPIIYIWETVNFIHNNGNPPHLHHATIFYPYDHSRCHDPSWDSSWDW